MKPFSFIILGIFTGMLLSAQTFHWPQELLSDEIPVSVRKVPASERQLDLPEDVEAWYLAGEGGTEIYALIGFPAEMNGPVPGVVLLHGGGGTAFWRWVKLWNERGYAAISIDLSGCRPARDQDGYANNTNKLPNGGPNCFYFEFTDRPPTEQWPYFSVAAALRAHSYLRSRPEVNPDQTGLIGISWGAFTGFMAAAADPRFRFFEAIYGCGNIMEESAWADDPDNRKQRDEFNAWWNPYEYAAAIQYPVFMAVATNDPAYHFGPWAATADRVTSEITRLIQLDFYHGYPPCGDPREGIRFANASLGLDDPLTAAGATEVDGNEVGCSYDGDRIARAELLYTTDTGKWASRNWKSIPAVLHPPESRASAPLPDGATAAFINLHDSTGLIVSSRPWIQNDQNLK